MKNQVYRVFIRSDMTAWSFTILETAEFFTARSITEGIKLIERTIRAQYRKARKQHRTLFPITSRYKLTFKKGYRLMFDRQFQIDKNHRVICSLEMADIH